MAATAESVLKPDFQAARKHFIFTDEHEQLRESIRNFAIKELAPHAEEWEETTFPDSVFHRMGELGFLGLDKPEAYGGQGGDYYSALVLAEEIGNANSGGRKSVCRRPLSRCSRRTRPSSVAHLPTSAMSAGTPPASGSSQRSGRPVFPSTTGRRPGAPSAISRTRVCSLRRAISQQPRSIW